MGRGASVRHKHLQLDQHKLNQVKSALGVATETQALEEAMSIVLAERSLLETLRRLRKKGRIERLFN